MFRNPLERGLQPYHDVIACVFPDELIAGSYCVGGVVDHARLNGRITCLECTASAHNSDKQG
jgi:hypothetical protein